MELKLRSVLGELIRARGVTYRHIAEKFSIPRSVLCGWSAGSHPRDLSKAAAIAQYLGVSFHYFIFGVDEADPRDEATGKN